MKTNILTFEEALSEADDKKNLLLGNGFSIACAPNIFAYNSLFEQAKKGQLKGISELKEVFDALKTTDFEIVIKELENTSKVLSVYDKKSHVTEKLIQHSDKIKNILIDTISENHPRLPSNIENYRFMACRKFLSNFIGVENAGRIYTLNYDLLLYWTLMNNEDNDIKLKLDDGFRGNKNDYVKWNSEVKHETQNIHYVHGALHIFNEEGITKKCTWSNSGIPLIEQVRSAMNCSMFPLFVTEGDSLNKLTKIRKNAYLLHSFKSFSEIMKQSKQSLFIYGHSLADNDAHILEKISKGKVNKVFISLYGGLESNKSLVERAKKIEAERDEKNPLIIHFFDAESAKVWG